MLTAAPVAALTDARGAQVRSLLELSLRGLPAMFYPEKSLFCCRIKQTSDGLVRDGISHRYTLMTLLGLHRAVGAGLRPPIGTEAVLRELARDTSWINNAGDLGLYLWLCALACPDQLPSLLPRLKLAQAQITFSDLRERRTMELAWFLTGLSHMKLAGVDGGAAFTDNAVQIWRLLEGNRGPHGLFGHQARGVMGNLRGRIGTFADQVYPIYGLTRFAQAFGEADALQGALDCGDAICRLQGPLGQWWWRYDSRSGRVASQYPVYSVHQDAMAPLALFPLGEVASRDFTEAIFKGLA